MMRTETHGRVALAVALAWCFAVPASTWAALPAKLSGSISGQVTDSLGIPQMGAAVLLYNRQDRLSEKALTDERGRFVFAGLMPDVYSIRVTLASFVPAIRNHVLVQPGVRSMLNVSLATLFSSIQLVYPGGEHKALMDDDWKWVLRSSSETRPVLRILPVADPAGSRKSAVIFSDTRGMVSFSTGDSNAISGVSTETDLGTAFALATSLYGKNQLQVAGKLGYGPQSGVPSAAFRTSFSRQVGGASPEVSVTMRQMSLPDRLFLGGAGNAPALRSMSLDFAERTDLTDTLSLEYGFSLDSVTFLDRLNYFSPFARLSYSVGESGMLKVTYTSGNARPELGAPAAADTHLQQELSTLAMFPRVSLRGGRAKVQRGENYEAAYSQKIGSREVEVSAYRESVSNAALTMDAPDGLYSEGDLLPDLMTGSAVFNAGDYQSTGYTAALTQNFGDNFSASVIYGTGGALTASRGEVLSENPDDLRAMIRTGRKHAATLRVTATVPVSGTRVVASYQWTDPRWITPGHLYSTQSLRAEPGLNLYFRQPLPVTVFPVRMEITADLRNLLAQGYLPVSVAGRRALLTQTPRALRGGVNFIF